MLSPRRMLQGVLASIHPQVRRINRFPRRSAAAFGAESPFVAPVTPYRGRRSSPHPATPAAPVCPWRRSLIVARLPIPAPGAAELLHHGCDHDSSALVCLCDRCKDRHRLHDRPALTSTVNAEPSMPFSKSDALARGSAAQTRLTLCWVRHACLRCIATNRECDVPALISNPTTSHPSRSVIAS